ncbi:MAG: PhzF family phenazine biosynthesis protein [Candidatus Bathyarchaeota archaeon]|nr:MAG: PhzF family phenazine biosynthesis protein [Candidatus Bathyarchaeota archaeon]
MSIYQVDAFAAEPFTGNPGGVCLLREPLKDEIMAKIAAEMNLSETAFVHPLAKQSFQKATVFSLRWFTPKVEVSLCGHATLATAAVLFREVKVNTNELEFRTKSGSLRAKESQAGIHLFLPADDPIEILPPRQLLRTLGVKDFIDIQYGSKTRSLLVCLPREEDVHSLSPDYKQMESSETQRGVEGVIVTAQGSHRYDFISRFFAPWMGINEDPVTGAAHTVLAPYWSRILGKMEMKAYQASARGGELTVRLGSGNTVELIGNAVVVLKGELMI